MSGTSLAFNQSVAVLGIIHASGIVLSLISSVSWDIARVSSLFDLSEYSDEDHRKAKQISLEYDKRISDLRFLSHQLVHSFASQREREELSRDWIKGFNVLTEHSEILSNEIARFYELERVWDKARKTQAGLFSNEEPHNNPFVSPRWHYLSAAAVAAAGAAGAYALNSIGDPEFKSDAHVVAILLTGMGSVALPALLIYLRHLHLDYRWRPDMGPMDHKAQFEKFKTVLAQVRQIRRLPDETISELKRLGHPIPENLAPHLRLPWLKSLADGIIDPALYDDPAIRGFVMDRLQTILKTELDKVPANDLSLRPLLNRLSDALTAVRTSAQPQTDLVSFVQSFKIFASTNNLSIPIDSIEWAPTEAALRALKLTPSIDPTPQIIAADAYSYSTLGDELTSKIKDLLTAQRDRSRTPPSKRYELKVTGAKALSLSGTSTPSDIWNLTLTLRPPNDIKLEIPVIVEVPPATLPASKEFIAAFRKDLAKKILMLTNGQTTSPCQKIIESLD